MKHVLILSITILGCVQFIEASDPKNPGTIRKSRSNKMMTQLSPIPEGSAGVFVEKSPLAICIPVEKSMRFLPISESPVIVKPSISVVIYQDVAPVFPGVKGCLWLDCGQVRLHPKDAIGKPLAQYLGYHIVRVLREIRFSDGSGMRQDDKIFREDGDEFVVNLPKDAHKRLLTRLPDHFEDIKGISAFKK